MSIINDNKDLHKILEQSKTIAMIGCSPNVYRTSNYAAKFLKQRGYKIIPVNPETEKVDGMKSYDRLTDIPDDVQIDIVNVFRNSKYAADAVRDVINRKNETQQNPVVWTQLDVSSSEAEKLALDAGLPYVKNRCIMVEHDRLMGK